MSAPVDVARVICRVADLRDPGSRAFTMGSGDWPLRGFLVRRGAEVFAYVNRCSHAGHPLSWIQDQFLTADARMILCHSHGALFEIATGACLGGPCAGRGLTQIGVEIREGYVLLKDDPDVLAQKHA